MFIAHLNIEVIAHSVDSDSMKTSICQVAESGAEHIWTPVCLEVIPDLETPWVQGMKRHVVLFFKLIPAEIPY